VKIAVASEVTEEGDMFTNREQNYLIKPMTYTLAWHVLIMHYGWRVRERFGPYQRRLTMTYTRSLSLLLSALLLASIAMPAYAVTFTLGNNPQSDEQNVLYSASQTGTGITGLTNQSNTSVLFTSTETLQTTALGQANLTATDGAINNVTIAVPGRTYGDLILNPLVGAPGQQSVPATVSVLASSGTATFNYNLTQGNNFLTILAVSGETITSTTITSGGGFADLRQVRISGLSGVTPPTAVPEPASVLLLVTGVAGLLMMRRRFCQ
jgi:hypothetical protein